MDLLFHKMKCFDIDGLEFPMHVKRDWRARAQYASKPAYIKYIQILQELVRFKPGITVIDIGCGIGSDIAELSWLGANCIGIEVQKECIHLLNIVRRNNRLNLTCILCDANFMPFRYSIIDVAMSNQFFEHVANIDQCLKEQIRLIVKRGRLIIRQANLLSPILLFDLLIKYPIRSHGKFGGIKWLFTKGKVRQNIYGTGWAGKDEDVHSRFWWWRKMKRYHNYLQIEEFGSVAEKTRGKLLGRIFGDILIVAKKR